MKTPTLLLTLTAALFCGAALPATASLASNPGSAPTADVPSAKSVAGAVTAKSATELTVKQSVGEPIVIVLTDQTKYLRGGDEAKASDVTVGSTVLVSLKTNADGKAEAEKVTLTDKPTPVE
jgi:hypothetical protein